MDNHFYIRTSGATVPLGVGELRTAFGLRESGVQRIEAFRTERLLKITAGETPVPMHEGPAVVLHMAPLPSFANRDLLDIVTMVANGNLISRQDYRERRSAALAEWQSVLG